MEVVKGDSQQTIIGYSKHIRLVLPKDDPRFLSTNKHNINLQLDRPESEFPLNQNLARIESQVDPNSQNFLPFSFTQKLKKKISTNFHRFQNRAAHCPASCNTSDYLHSSRNETHSTTINWCEFIVKKCQFHP